VLAEGCELPVNPATANPTRIGKYEIESVIGRGGMGVVYRALDPQLGRQVAIKMIISGGDQELLTRFIQEAKSTGRLQSPNIVTVYDFGEQEGNPYLVMEYIEGTSLEAIIKSGAPLTLAEKLGIVIDVCNGLSYAHEQGVIHRDMKPANIMVLKKDGTAKIVDFGIARIGGSRLTRTDQVIGSVEYMSPEQLQNKHLDHRTDIFSTAVVLYQLLTGELPFHANETAATLYKIVYDPPPPLDLGEFPAELQAALGRALAKNAQERYETARDLALDLIQIQDRQKQETVAQYMRRAEFAMQRNEWAKAGEQLQLVLRIDRQNTTARRLNSEVQEKIRQQQRIEQARHLRAQAEEALSELRYDDALQLVKHALTLDENNPDLQTLRETVLEAKQRAARLQHALRRAETAQQEGDIEEAVRAIDEALVIDPSDTQARALQVILKKQAEERARQDKLRQLLEEARKQISSRELTKALSTLKIAEAIDPHSPEVATVAKLALAAREQEKRRLEIEQLRKAIEEDLVREDYSSAITRAEEGLRKSPLDQSLLKLKTLAEQQRNRAEQKAYARDQCKAAGQLLESGRPAEALTLIDRALARTPGNLELEGLRETIKQRLASESGMRQIEELRRERRRAVADDLDRQLAREASPDGRVLLAQEALQKDPENEFLQQRLAPLLEIQQRYVACIESAQRLEQAGNYPQAIREWERVAKEWPQHPKAAAEIQRLTSLARTPKPAAQARISTPPPPPAPPSAELEASATKLFTPVPVKPRVVTRPVETPGADLQKRDLKARDVRPTPPQPIPPRREPPRALPNKLLWVAAAALSVVVIALVIYWVWPTSATVKVRIQTDPSDSTVSAGGKSCQTPCALALKPGDYEIRAVHDGYEAIAKQTRITSGTTELPTIVLSKTAPIAPKLGALSVRANVDAVDVFVDGDLKGQTGRKGKVFTLEVGGHQVRVEKPGYETETAPQQIDIATDHPFELPEFKLKPSTNPVQPVDSYVMVRGSPGASVSVDHRASQKIAGDGTVSVKVEPGAHGIEVSKDGYQPWSKNITVGKGERQQITADLQPIPQRPPAASFESSAASIQQGQSAELAWHTQNATEVSIDNGIGNVELNGTKRVSPSSTTSYNLRVRGPGGTTAKEVVISVNIPPPAPPPSRPSIERFEAERDTIQQGQSTKLNWQTENTTQVSIDNGVGSVGKSGTQQVGPSKTTTYTLTATGGSAATTRQVTITVTAPPPPQPAAGNLDDVKAAIERYRDAYETLSVDEVRKAWPGIPRNIEKKIDESFKAFRAIRLQIEYGTPSVSGDTAQWLCTQTMTYTTKDGKRQPPQRLPVVFSLRKSGGVWYVQDMHGQ
jgi:tetratricopeptide (TPR) repeat protein